MNQQSFFHMAETGLATWTTLAMRMPVLMALATQPTENDRVEGRRMVDEKVMAMWEGMVAAQQALFKLSFAMLTGEVRTVNAYTSAMADMMQVAAAPAHSKVRANARRLTRVK